VLLAEPEEVHAPGRRSVRARVRGGPVQRVRLEYFAEEPVAGLDEWAGFHFLSQRGLPFCPRWLAGDEQARLLVVEDVGSGTRLEELLRGKEAAAAERGVLGLARLTGALHTRTLGAQAEYDQVRQALTPRSERVRVEEARLLLEHSSRLERWMAAVDGTVAEGTTQDLEALARELADPGPLLAFTHGRPSGESVLYTQAGPRLVDLRDSGMRHALWDALPWLVELMLPTELAERADVSHRLALSSVCPAAQVDSVWARARATVVLARTVMLLQKTPPRSLEQEPAGASEPSGRTLLLHHLRRSRALRWPVKAYPALGGTLEVLEAGLRERWQGQPFAWPAFR
jgi:hypothetical protein